jgi:hypothetical protein
MAKKTRKVLTLKHGRGKVHELDCRWLNGPRATTDWSKYHTVRADEAPANGHCSHC